MSTTATVARGGVDVDEDLSIFTGTLGVPTSGSFALHFDGSDVELDASSEDVDAGSMPMPSSWTKKTGSPATGSAPSRRQPTSIRGAWFPPACLTARRRRWVRSAEQQAKETVAHTERRGTQSLDSGTGIDESPLDCHVEDADQTSDRHLSISSDLAGLPFVQK